MATNSIDRSSDMHGFPEVSVALLGGLMILGFSVFLVTLADVGIGPPLNAAPLFVWNTTAAAIALVFAIQ